MFDMSWSEMLLIAVVALIVIGPKDLPKVVKTLAGYARKARSLAREFQSGLEEMARDAELEEMKRAVEETTSTDIAKELENSIDPSGSTTRIFEKDPDYVPPAEVAAPEEPTAPPLPAPAAPATAAPAAALEPAAVEREKIPIARADEDGGETRPATRRAER